jgi:autotransporter-associated beta strand protein
MTQAQTSLSVGDVQILGVTADAPDSYAFVLWKDIAAGTLIRVTDNSFTSTTGTTLLSGNENNMTLTFGSALTAGTVVRYQDGVGVTVSSGTAPTASGTLSGTANGGDQVFLYQGTSITSGNTAFSGSLLHGFNIADTNWLASGTATNSASYLPSVLNVTDGSFDSANLDNAEYIGARSGLTTGFYRAAVSNITNHGGNDTALTLNSGGFSIQSSASVNWDANGTTAGMGGTGTWDTTTTDRFRNGASGTTSFRWVNSSTGNDHTAVFGGTAGTVSLATGGVTASGLQFDTTGYAIQSDTLTLAGTTPLISVSTGTATITSVLASSSGLEKTGSGTLVLDAANTVSGPISITAGSVAVKNTTGSATGSGNVTVTGSTILGTGRVSPAPNGSVIFGNAAIVSVGDAGDTSGKTLIFTPASGTMSTTFQAGSVLEVALFTGAGSGDNSGIGTAADALQWGGTLALQSNVKLRVNNPNGMTTFAEGDSWKVLDWTTFGGSAPTGTFEASMLELPTLTGLLAWDTSMLYTAGTIGIIQVPEPSRAVLMLLGTMGLMARRRRKQSRALAYTLD